MTRHTHLALLGLLCVSIVPALAREPRTCAGNVQAQVVNGKLFITGDDEPNCITLIADQNENVEQVLVIVGGYGTSYPAPGTTVNGEQSIELPAVTGDVLVRTGDGNDIVSLAETDRFPGSLKIDTGDGDDTVINDDTRVERRFDIRTGDGNDSVNCGTCESHDSITISTGDGDDLLWGGGGVYGNRVYISMGRGNDTINGLGLPIVGDQRVTITTGSGNDILNLEDGAEFNLNLSLGSCDDTLTQMDLRGAARLNGGTGFDTLGPITLSDLVPTPPIVRSFEDWRS